MDALRVEAEHLTPGRLASNAVVVGTPPDRLKPWTRTFEVALDVDGRTRRVVSATTVVIAVGQFLGGFDVVPRGHPGDGRAEVQAYTLPRNQRAGLRRRLRSGTHLPHPRILTLTGRRVELRTDRPVALEIDRVTDPGRHRQLRMEVSAHHYRLLV